MSGATAFCNYPLRRLAWCFAWPVRHYIRHSPWAHGKGFITRILLEWILPDLPATFSFDIGKGLTASLYYRETLGRSILIHGAFEHNERQLLSKRARQGTTAIDVGANVGLFTLALAQAVGERGRVLSFEPCRETTARLMTNIDANNVHNVSVYALALSDSKGVLTLHQGRDSAFNRVEKISGAPDAGRTADLIECGRLDDIWVQAGQPNVSVMKIDVEGFELPVLSGSQEVLSRCRPVLLLEADSPEALARLDEFLGRFRYERFHPAGFMPWNHLYVPT